MKRLLLSVAKITKVGNHVDLGEDEAFIKNNKTGQITNLRRERNVWMLDLWVKRPADAMNVSSFQRLGPLRTCAGTTVTTTGPVPVRPLLAPIDEESAPMEDDEGGEDELMQEEAEEGRRPLFRKSENQPSSQEVQEHMKTHIPCRSWCAHCVRGRGEMIPTGQEEEGEDQEIIHTSQWTTDSSRRTILMSGGQIRGATRSS